MARLHHKVTLLGNLKIFGYHLGIIITLLRMVLFFL